MEGGLKLTCEAPQSHSRYRVPARTCLPVHGTWNKHSKKKKKANRRSAPSSTFAASATLGPSSSSSPKSGISTANSWKQGGTADIWALAVLGNKVPASSPSASTSTQKFWTAIKKISRETSGTLSEASISIPKFSSGSSGSGGSSGPDNSGEGDRERSNSFFTPTNIGNFDVQAAANEVKRAYERALPEVARQKVEQKVKRVTEILPLYFPRRAASKFASADSRHISGTKVTSVVADLSASGDKPKKRVVPLRNSGPYHSFGSFGLPEELLEMWGERQPAAPVAKPAEPSATPASQGRDNSPESVNGPNHPRSSSFGTSPSLERSTSSASSAYNEYHMPKVRQQHDKKSTIRPELDVNPGLHSPPNEPNEEVSRAAARRARRNRILERNRVPASQASRTRCRYGDACRRNNPKHFAQFAHPVTHPRLQLWDEWCVVEAECGEAEAAEVASFEKKYELQRSTRDSKQLPAASSTTGSTRKLATSSPVPLSRPSSVVLRPMQASAELPTRASMDDSSDDDDSGCEATNFYTETEISAPKAETSDSHPPTGYSSDVSQVGYSSDDIFGTSSAKVVESAYLFSGAPMKGKDPAYCSDDIFAAAAAEHESGAKTSTSLDIFAAAAAKHESKPLSLLPSTAKPVARPAGFFDSLSPDQMRQALSILAGERTSSSVDALTAAAIKRVQSSFPDRSVGATPRVGAFFEVRSPKPPLVNLRLSLAMSRDSHVKSGYWNGEFLNAASNIRRLNPNTRHTERIARYRKLAVHGQDFIELAKTYGAILISEVGLDDSLKTIPALKGKGFAGGDKYFVHGIYFKLAVDTHGMFGGSTPSDELFAAADLGSEVTNRMDGDERAMRVAGHELRHLISVFNCWDEKAHVAMCVCLDFRGFRMLAMSALPISEATLQYGSANAAAGQNMVVHTGASDSELSSTVESIAAHLNLKSHSITAARPSADGSFPRLCTAVDVEGHRGSDGRIYLLDLSRLFPPTDPEMTKNSTPDRRSDYLVYLFRPEFVITYPEALNSDAFSPFCKDAHDRTVIREATRYLLEEVVPAFVKQLLTVGQSTLSLMKSYPLVQMLHVHGINLRYMGKVRILVNVTPLDVDNIDLSRHRHAMSHWRFVLLMEMVARTIKQLLRKRLRDVTRMLRSGGDIFHNPWKRVVIDEMNCIFGALSNSGSDITSQMCTRIARTWDVITAELLRRFPDALDPAEEEWLGVRRSQIDGGAALRDLIVRCSPKTVVGATPKQERQLRQPSMDARCILFRTLCDQLGLVFSSQSYLLATCNPRVYEFQRPFEDTDLVEFVQRAKHLNIVAHSQGYLLRSKAIRRQGDEANRLFDNAIEQFQKALNTDPSNKQSLRNLAECLAFVGRLDEASFYFQAALNSDNQDTNTLFKFATFLDNSERLDDAEELYLLALEAHPYHSNALVAYADFLACERQDVPEAIKFYETALACDPKSPYAHNNLACLLALCFEDPDKVDRATQLFRQAAECDDRSPMLLRNLAIHLAAIAETKGEAVMQEALAARDRYLELREELAQFVDTTRSQSMLPF